MKFIRRIVYLLIIIFILLTATSVETDFFSNIDKYIPEICEKFPVVLDVASEIEEMTEDIPSISQIIALLKDEPLPVNPEDLAVGKYNKKSPMLNFYPNENMGVIIKNSNVLSVFGVLKDERKSNVLVQLTDSAGEEISRKTVAVNSKTFEFQAEMTIPTEYDCVHVNIFTGEKGYGEFSSYAVNYITLENNGAGFSLRRSPVLEHNENMYTKGKSISAALKETGSIQLESDTLKSIANQLTGNVEDDYEKIVNIHDWVSSYLYYNVDYINDSKVAPYKTEDVLTDRNVVCLGYANLFAALCRSVNIPCYVVSGYALGIDSKEFEWTEKLSETTDANHVWNEAYVNGRWVIVDTTWDSFNTYENGEMKNAEKISRLYFDANPEFFSADHKIIEYLNN